MSNVLNNMLGHGEAFHEKTEKLAKHVYSDKCSCNKCKMHKDKYSHNDVMIAGTPVSLNRP